jgi:hypothetical protein
MLYSRDYDQTYAGVYKSVIWKIVLAFAVLYNFECEQINAQIVFLNNNIDGLVYINIPPSWTETYILVNLVVICKLLKGLYRLKQSL